MTHVRSGASTRLVVALVLAIATGLIVAGFVVWPGSPPPPPALEPIALVGVTVVDVSTGEISRLFEGVFGAEVTGLTVTPDRRTLFCNLQHPDPDTSVGRDSTIVITRKDGGIVGS